MNQNLHVIYRISDKSHLKSKIADKAQCLKNAIEIFGGNNIHIVANDCEAATLRVLRQVGLDVEAINTGSNSGSFKYILNEVANRYEPNDCLYILEDDYLHLPNSREAILEGLEIADYVTLYDHPDMYHSYGAGGDNPFVRGDRPKCSVYLTAHTHWRSVVSTTMTFAVKAKTFIEDRNMWNVFCQGAAPLDFPAFVTLTKQDDIEDMKYFRDNGLDNLSSLMFQSFMSKHKKRLLISPIPSLSTHTEQGYLAPIIDWSKLS